MSEQKNLLSKHVIKQFLLKNFKKRPDAAKFYAEKVLQDEHRLIHLHPQTTGCGAVG